MEIYLDNSATTRPCDAAVAAMLDSMRNGYYNPSALYKQAVDVERMLMTAREEIARPIEADERQVIFTAGGTESDNLAIMGYLMQYREAGEVLYSAAEHPAVKVACQEAAALYGHTAREIPLTSRGMIDLAALERMLHPRVYLICVMQVCNETGVMMPLEAVVALRDQLACKAAIHVDGVQGYLRVPFSMKKLKVQSYAISAHKLHGPKGIGALVTAPGHRLRPLMLGGGQQMGMRSGTENTVGIAGFAAAVKHHMPIQAATNHLTQLKQAVFEALAAAIPQMHVLGAQPGEADAAPHILYASFAPVRAETLVHALAEEGIMVGTGSACSSRKHKRSAVLTAMGISPAAIDSSLRISFSTQNTRDEVLLAAEKLITHYQMLARFTRR